MSVYEIVNPSDPYTMQGEFRPCAMATILLGKGAYVLQDEQGETVVPIMFLGGSEEWSQKTFGQALADVLHGTPDAEPADYGWAWVGCLLVLACFALWVAAGFGLYELGRWLAWVIGL